jgi:hypothetical protein
LIVAVPFPLSVKFTPVGRAPVLVSAAVGLPVLVTLNVPFDPTANVTVLALVIEGGTCTVTDVVAVTVEGVVAEFETVNVYVVVEVGETLTGVPLVTAPTPLLMLPVPPVNTAVSVVEVPVTMMAAPGVKLVMAGAGTTVTVVVKVAVAGVVAAFVTVSV